MAGRGIGQNERDRIENSDERGDDAVGLFRAERPVGGIENVDRLGENLRRAAHGLTDGAHRHCGQQPAAHDVADREHDPSIVEAERVVPIAADERFGFGSTIDRHEAHARNGRHAAREGGFLKCRRGAMLALEFPLEEFVLHVGACQFNPRVVTCNVVALDRSLCETLLQFRVRTSQLHVRFVVGARQLRKRLAARDVVAFDRSLCETFFELRIRTCQLGDRFVACDVIAFDGSFFEPLLEFRIGAGEFSHRFVARDIVAFDGSFF